MPDPVNIRASSIAAIVDCPLRGLSIALGLVKQLPSTAPAVIGSACHAGTAAFDQAVIEGNPITPDDAAEVVVDYLQHPEDEVNWGTMRPEEAERRALGVHTRYCVDVAPTINFQKVELTLDQLVVDVGGVEIELTGTLDRIYQEDGRELFIGSNIVKQSYGILDIKTGATACSQKPGKHKAQIAVYELLAERTLGREMNLPGLIAQLQTSREYQVDVKSVEDARAALLGTEEQIGLLGHIAHMLESGDWYGNSSSWLCSEKYCPLFSGCIFK